MDKMKEGGREIKEMAKEALFNNWKQRKSTKEDYDEDEEKGAIGLGKKDKDNKQKWKRHYNNEKTCNQN